MKKIITIILITLSVYSSYSQDRAVRVNVVKYDPVTTVERDSYVVPANQVWKIYNSTTARWEENVSGAGWVASASGGGGGTTTDAGDLITGTLDDARLSSSVTASLGLANSALQAEVDGSVTNELQTLSILGNTLSISDGNSITIPSSGGGGASDWGDLGGTLSDQTDLQAELDDKANINTGSPKQWIGFASGTQAEIDANISTITNATPANGTTFIFPTDAAAGTDGFVTSAAFTDVDADTKRLTLTMNGVMSDLTADFDLPTGGSGSFDLVTDLTPELGGNFDGGGFDMYNIEDFSANGVSTPSVVINSSLNISYTAEAQLNGLNRFIGVNIFDPRDSFLPEVGNSTHVAEEGEVYWNSTDNRLKAYDGTSWKNFLLEGDASGSISNYQSLTDRPFNITDTGAGGIMNEAESNGDIIIGSAHVLDVLGSLYAQSNSYFTAPSSFTSLLDVRFLKIKGTDSVDPEINIEYETNTPSVFETATLNTNNKGELFYKETASGEVYKIQISKSGTTAQRPDTPVTGQQFFDTTLGYPIWYNGTNWVDATGTTR